MAHPPLCRCYAAIVSFQPKKRLFHAKPPRTQRKKSKNKAYRVIRVKRKRDFPLRIVGTAERIVVFSLRIVGTAERIVVFSLRIVGTAERIVVFSLRNVATAGRIVMFPRRKVSVNQSLDPRFSVRSVVISEKLTTDHTESTGNLMRRVSRDQSDRVA